MRRARGCVTHQLMKRVLLISAVLCGLALATPRVALAIPSLRDGEGFVLSNGVKIWYRVEGATRRGIPILIIHGGPGETARPFERTIGPLLALSRPVIYTDYRGAGRSERPSEPAKYSFNQLADDLEAIRSTLGVFTWAVFGHSNGGATAITYALRHSDATRALVLCDPLLSPRDLEVNMAHKVTRAPAAQAMKLRAIFQSPALLSERFEQMFPEMDPGWQQRLMFYDPRAGAIFDELQRGLAMELGGKELMAPALWDGLVASGFFAFDAFPNIGRLAMPTLVLVGRVDSEISIDNSALFSASLPAGHFAVIEQAGHFPFLESPGATTAEITRFLQDVEAHGSRKQN